VLGSSLVTSEEFQTMSAALFRRLGIDEAEFRKLVGEAGDEREVVDWVLSHTNAPEAIAKWNERIGGLCIERLDHETKRHLKSLSPTVVSVPASTPILEALDREDDAASAAAKRP
jgi:alpha/beta superfamily hydrolase